MSPSHQVGFNFFLAAVFTSAPWWIVIFENTSWFAARILPIIGVAVGLLQLWFLLRKLRRK
jgi:hypothetical protein